MDGLNKRPGLYRSILLLSGCLALSSVVRAQQTTPPPTPDTAEQPVTVSPEQTPPPPVLPRIVAPLSVYESCLLLRDAIQTLEGENNLSPGSRATLTDRTLRVVGDYVSWVDRTHTTLPYYRWAAISSEKIRRLGWETRIIQPDRPITRVTALALRVEHADVEIKQITALGKKNIKWIFNRKIEVLSGQRRPELCYLPLPTDLTEIRIVQRRIDPEDERRPRLYIEAGVCSIPESAKAAVYYMEVARGELKKLDLKKSARLIGQALSALEDYQAIKRPK